MTMEKLCPTRAIKLDTPIPQRSKMYARRMCLISCVKLRQLGGVGLASYRLQKGAVRMWRHVERGIMLRATTFIYRFDVDAESN